MKDSFVVVKNAWLGFLQSDRSSFLVYGILIAVWSIVLASNMSQLALEANTLWWVFFSVIVSGTFSTSIFTSERLTGALEIVLTCGLSRMSILAGKIVFVILISAGLGFLCYGLALIWVAIAGEELALVVRATDFFDVAVLYLAACFMNASCGAWLSVRLSNPRLSSFANLLILGVIVGGHAVLSAVLSVSAWLLPAVLCGGGLVFLFLAARDFSGERVIQPFTL